MRRWLADGAVALVALGFTWWLSAFDPRPASVFVSALTATSAALLLLSSAAGPQPRLRVVQLLSGGVAAVGATLFTITLDALTDLPGDESRDPVLWRVALTTITVIVATAAAWRADVRISRLEDIEQQARDDLATARHAELLLELRSAAADPPPAPSRNTPRAGWAKAVLRAVGRRGSTPAAGR